MGQSWFSAHRRNDYYYAPTAATAPIPPAPPAAPAGSTASQAPTPFRRASSPSPTPPLRPLRPPSTRPPTLTSTTRTTQCSPYPPTTRPPPSFSPYYHHAPSGWWPQQQQQVPPNYAASSSAWAAPTHAPPPYVEHQQAKTVKNDVNVRKETICLEVDEHFPDQHLVSFTFDAAVDGSITIFYFAKEGKDCSFASIYPELCRPMRIPFQKGPGQQFCQPPGSSIDLGFFELDDLSYAVNDVFPLVIYAEAGQQAVDEQQEQTVDHRAQITLAVVEKKGDGPFQVKVIKQILWIDCQRYELQEIFGLGSSMEAKVDEEDAGKECVICMSEPRDTAVFPCRHMCMCSECAKALRLQTNKCPVCRQPVNELREIKIKSGNQ